MALIGVNNMYTDCIAIKDIRPNLKNINVVFIVLEVGAATVTKENRVVRTFKVADPTACINVSVWDEPGNLLVPGDIVRLTKGYAAIWRHCLTLYSGKNGEIQKIGDFCLAFNEHINMSEPNPNLATAINPMNQKNAATTVATVVPSPMLINNGTTTNNNNGNSVVLISATVPPSTATPTVIVTTSSAATSVNNSVASTAKSTGNSRSASEHGKSTPNKTTGRGGRNNPSRNNAKAERR